MKTLDELPAGTSWATKFRTTTFLRDGEPITANLAVGERHPGTPGVYEGVGVIVKRDSKTKMLEVIDTASQQRFTVSYDNCWDWDEVLWNEKEC
jgi:hypothetical protein